jgi:hypothetical protein
MKLNNQEIRNCIYSGPFNALLRDLDENPAWRRINKMRPKQSYRYTKQELMLRFFAFQENRSRYEGHLAKFLNSYMQRHQRAAESLLSQKRDLFTQTVSFIDAVIFDGSAPPKLSLTLLEALLVGVGENVPDVTNLLAKEAKARYHTLVTDPAFTEAALREGLSKRQRVIDRLKRSAEIFAP